MPLMPGGSSLYVSAPLTNVAVAYQNSPMGRRFVAADVFPVVNVARQGDLYWVYDRGDWFRGQAEKRAPATESVGAGWNVTSSSYYAHVYALHKDLDDQTIANATALGGAFNLDADATRFVTANLLQKREKVWTTSFMTTGVWTGASGIGGGSSGTDLTGGAAAGSNTFVQWDRSGSDPVGDINRQIIGMAEKTGFRPNTLTMGPYVWNALMQNTNILSRIQYSQTGIISEDLLRALFNVDRLYVLWANENPVNQGATTAMAFMSAKSALLTYSPPTPSTEVPSAGYIFAWAGFLGAGAYATRVKRFRMEQIESYRVEAEMAFDMKVVAPDLGVYFNSAVQ